MATTNPFDIKTGASSGMQAKPAAAPTSGARKGINPPPAPAPAPTPPAPPAPGAPAPANPPPAPTATAPGAVQTTQATAATTGPTAQAKVTDVAVDPTKQTVQGQLAGILASGNPLLVQAQTRAAQESNRRGILNSSMAVGAGESALYDAAMPIAQADADVYNQQAFTNAGERNTTSRYNAGESNTQSRFNTGEQNTTARQNAAETNQNTRFSAEQDQQTRLANLESQSKVLLQQMDADTRVEMTNIEANYRTLMQASQSASDLYQQTLKNISDITMNKDLDAGAKNAAIAQQKAYLQNGMNLISSMNNLDVEELLNFDIPGFEPGGVKEVDPPSTRAPGTSFGGVRDAIDAEVGGA
jgi:hypothetical protein